LYSVVSQKVCELTQMERQRFLGELQGVFAPFFRSFLRFPVDFPVISRLVYR
jgi:hypothetical protein